MAALSALKFGHSVVAKVVQSVGAEVDNSVGADIGDSVDAGVVNSDAEVVNSVIAGCQRYPCAVGLLKSPPG